MGDQVADGSLQVAGKAAGGGLQMRTSRSVAAACPYVPGRLSSCDADLLRPATGHLQPATCYLS